MSGEDGMLTSCLSREAKYDNAFMYMYVQHSTDTVKYVVNSTYLNTTSRHRVSVTITFRSTVPLPVVMESEISLQRALG